MQLGRAFGDGLARDLQRLLDAVRVGVGLARRAVEAAELAVGVADVGLVEMAVDVEVGGAPVQAAADGVGEPAEGGHVFGREKREAVGERQPLAGFDFGGELFEPGVV